MKTAECRFDKKSVREPPASPGFPSAPLLPTNGRTGHRTTWSGPYDGGAEEEVQGQKGTEESRDEETVHAAERARGPAHTPHGRVPCDDVGGDRGGAGVPAPPQQPCLQLPPEDRASGAETVC